MRSGTSLRESLTKPLQGASGQNLLQFMFSPPALPLSAFCFPSVHPISQMKLNLVCSVSNFLFLSLFSLSVAALLPCLSSALQLLEQQNFLGLPLSFTVSGLLPELQINNYKYWAREHQWNKNEFILYIPYFLSLKLLSGLILQQRWTWSREEIYFFILRPTEIGYLCPEMQALSGRRIPFPRGAGCQVK